ncbi:MAG: hypothetical protein U0Y68_04675 [Blastocatellia bacterium]
MLARTKKLIVEISGLALLASLGWAQVTPVRIPPPTKTAATPTKNETPSPVEPRAANRVVVSEAGIQYEIPAGWRTEDHTGAKQITSPDGGVSIIIGLAVNDNTEAMIVGLKDYLKQDYANFKVASDLQKESINDLRALIENGSGETSEGVMEWNIVVLIGGKRPLIAFTVAEQKAFKSSQGDYIKLVQSIKKVN